MQYVLLFKTALTEFNPHYTEAKSAVGVVVRDIVIIASRGGSRGDVLPLPAIFKNAFDEYNFSVISNLFDNSKPYALRPHNRKCTNKIHHIW